MEAFGNHAYLASNQDIFQTKCDIIFVTHSLGGPVFQEALLDPRPVQNPMNRRKAMHSWVALSWDPHHESDLAVWGVLHG